WRGGLADLKKILDLELFEFPVETTNAFPIVSIDRFKRSLERSLERFLFLTLAVVLVLVASKGLKPLAAWTKQVGRFLCHPGANILVKTNLCEVLVAWRARFAVRELLEKLLVYLLPLSCLFLQDGFLDEVALMVHRLDALRPSPS